MCVCVIMYVCACYQNVYSAAAAADGGQQLHRVATKWVSFRSAIIKRIPRRSLLSQAPLSCLANGLAWPAAAAAGVFVCVLVSWVSVSKMWLTFSIHLANGSRLVSALSNGRKLPLSLEVLQALAFAAFCLN